MDVAQRWRVWRRDRRDLSRDAIRRQRRHGLRDSVRQARWAIPRTVVQHLAGRQRPTELGTTGLAAFFRWIEAGTVTRMTTIRSSRAPRPARSARRASSAAPRAL